MKRLLLSFLSPTMTMRTVYSHQRGYPSRTHALIPLLAFAFFLAATTAAFAAPSVAPGATHIFPTPDGGETECRIDVLAVACGFPQVRFSGTDFDAVTKEVTAVFYPVVGTFGEANHASASLYNDFIVSDSVITSRSSDGVILAHISAGFDYNAFLLGAAAYTVDAELNLVISDVTDGAPGVPIASHTLATRDRSGDQGLTDISAGGQSVVLTNEGGGFTVLVRRGHTYRITFQATAYGAALILGRPSSDVTAKLKSLHVTLEEDEVEQLAMHDDAIRSDLAAHDATIQAQVSQHDADIKDLLRDLRERQEHIIQLLLTPQGRRESYLGSFPLKPDTTAALDVGGTTPIVQQTNSTNRRSSRSIWRRLFGGN